VEVASLNWCGLQAHACVCVDWASSPHLPPLRTLHRVAQRQMAALWQLKHVPGLRQRDGVRGAEAQAAAERLRCMQHADRLLRVFV
jgi:hypothetical protein